MLYEVNLLQDCPTSGTHLATGMWMLMLSQLQKCPSFPPSWLLMVEFGLSDTWYLCDCVKERIDAWGRQRKKLSRCTNIPCMHLKKPVVANCHHAPNSGRIFWTLYTLVSTVHGNATKTHSSNVLSVLAQDTQKVQLNNIIMQPKSWPTLTWILWDETLGIFAH